MIGFYAAGAMGSGAPPPPSSTFDPSLKGTNIVLSNGDIDATKAGAGYESVFGTAGHSSGRRAFEIHVTARPSASSILVGIADKTNPTPILSTYIGNNSGSVEAVGYNDFISGSNGRIFRRMTVGNIGGSLTGGYNNPDVITVDVDFSANTVVFRKNSVAISYGAIAITSGKTYFPAVSLQSGAAVRLKISGLTYLPSGASEWG